MAPTVAAGRAGCAAAQAPPCKRARLDGPGAPAAAACSSLSSLAPNTTCPITLKPVMELQDPVKDATGVVYERAAVTWFLRSLPARKRGRGITMLGSTHEVTLAELVPAAEVVQARERAARAKQQAALAKQQAAQDQQRVQQPQQQQQQHRRQVTNHQAVDLTGESPRSVLAHRGPARGGQAKGANQAAVAKPAAVAAKPAAAAPNGSGKPGGGAASTHAAMASQAAGGVAPASTGRHCGSGATSSKAAQPAKRPEPNPVGLQAAARAAAPAAAPPAAAAAAVAVRVPPKFPSPMPDLAKVRGARLTVHFGQR